MVITVHPKDSGKALENLDLESNNCLWYALLFSLSNTGWIISLHRRSREALVIPNTVFLCCYSSLLHDKGSSCWEGHMFFTCLIHGQAKPLGSVTAKGYNPFKAIRHFQIKKGSSLNCECCSEARGFSAPWSWLSHSPCCASGNRWEKIDTFTAWQSKAISSAYPKSSAEHNYWDLSLSILITSSCLLTSVMGQLEG